MNNELNEKLHLYFQNDDGSYTKIEKLADNVVISHTFKIPYKKKTNKKYKKYYALIKQREIHMREKFVNDITIHLQTRVTEELYNAILYGYTE